MMRSWMRHLAYCGICVACNVSSTHGFNAVLDSIGGPTTNAYASGRMVDSQANILADWNLITTVSNSDFVNDALVVGDRGVMYVMRNDENGSTDINSIVYSVIARPNVTTSGISITQSPYNDDSTWNGGNFEMAQFQIRWTGGGTARITDPRDQFAVLADGALISSGTTIRFSADKIYNNLDNWRIDLPSGPTTVEIDWSSVNPAANSDLTREWVTFDIGLTLVPEPSTLIFFALTGCWLAGRLRRRS